MKMLRYWTGDSNKIILEFLKKFGIKAKEITLQKYEALTPDSFIWYFNIYEDNKYTSYCLYAEDYIPNLDHVKEVINTNIPEWNDANFYELLPVNKQQKWQETSPVAGATVYNEPDDSDDIMTFATTSEYDFVFLAQAKEK